MKKLSFMFAYALAAIAFMTISFVGSADASDHSGRQPQTGGVRKPNGVPASTLININNIAGWIRNDGWSARVPSSGNSGVYFPRGTSTVIFQDGIVWGGNVNDGGSQVLRVGGQTYSIGTLGGRIISAGVGANPNDPDVRIFRIRRDYKTADLRQDAAEFFEKGLNSVTDGDIATVRAQYQTDWDEWPAAQGAPYYDRDSNHVYNPAIDEPGVADADQVIWFVCNDLNAGRTLALYGSNPIGLELQVTLWGYNRTDPLANVYFKKFTFIYKGTATTPANSTITDMYVGQWSDPDLGDYSDDFAGCDTTLSLAYVYNGKPIDSEYAKFGLKPPAIGYDFLQGPLVNGAPTDSAVFGLKRRYGKKNLPMTAAFYFAAGSPITDPPFTRDGSIQWYNLLRGLIPIGGAPFTLPPLYPGPTKFWLDGDPVAGTGRLDGVLSAPGDRRIGACSGPFTMAVGDTQEVVVGVVGGIGSDYHNSITVMKNNDVAVQNAYNDLFDLPKAPPAPKLFGTGLDKKVLLDWSIDAAAVSATEGFNRKGYTFEGYNVYQLPSPSASFDQAIRVATFDIVDGVRTIYDDVFDANLGIITRIVRQRGTDAGVSRRLVFTDDKVRTAPLVNGQRYYYAVTAYGYNPSDQALTHSLESSLGIVTVIPQTTDPGFVYSAANGDTVRGIVHTTVAGGKSDGNVEVYVVDPTKLTGHQYQVRFDTISASKPSWSLYDISATPPLLKLSKQENQTGDNLYATVDGLLIKVTGAPLGVKDFLHPKGPAGAITPPSYAAFSTFNSWGFPAASGSDAASGGGPSIGDWGGGRWGVHTGGSGNGDESYLGRFVPRVFRNDNFSRFVPYDFELRFTAAGGKAFLAFTSGNVINVPFELWNIGIGTPDDPSDDIRMIPWINDADGNNAFNLLRVDHGVSGGDNDPYTDWIYWYDPDPKVPGSAGYNAFVAAGAAYDGSQGTGGEVMARVVLVNVNGGSVSDPTWPANVNSLMPATGNIIRIIATKPNRSFGDLFTFNAPAAPAFDAKNAKADVSSINVFPNPYYGFNRAETSRNSRFVTFNHLPPRAEIRIFNLAGSLVRAFDETNTTLQRNGQYQNWDLKNQTGLPVASGVYIAYINMPDIGATKTLKLIIVQEQQYLENF